MLKTPPDGLKSQTAAIKFLTVHVENLWIY